MATWERIAWLPKNLFTFFNFFFLKKEIRNQGPRQRKAFTEKLLFFWAERELNAYFPFFHSPLYTLPSGFWDLKKWSVSSNMFSASALGSETRRLGSGHRERVTHQCAGGWSNWEGQWEKEHIASHSLPSKICRILPSYHRRTGPRIFSHQSK